MEYVHLRTLKNYMIEEVVSTDLVPGQGGDPTDLTGLTKVDWFQRQQF